MQTKQKVDLSEKWQQLKEKMYLIVYQKQISK